MVSEEPLVLNPDSDELEFGRQGPSFLNLLGYGMNTCNHIASADRSNRTRSLSQLSVSF
jgi:hypothetical protein